MFPLIALMFTLSVAGQGCPHQGSDHRLFGRTGCLIQRKLTIESAQPPMKIWSFHIGKVSVKIDPQHPHLLVEWPSNSTKLWRFRAGFRWDANARAYIFPAIAFKKVAGPMTEYQLGTDFSSSSVLHAAGAEPNLRITIRFYNETQASARTIARARAVTNRIFEKIGVELHWLDCRLIGSELLRDPACRHSFGLGEIAVSILARAPHPGLQENTCGFEYRSKDVKFGRYAEVYYDCNEHVALRECIDLHQILGHTMAHEIGHLLLGDVPHSPAGLMRYAWSRDDLERAGRGLLLFTALDSDRIRAQVQQRTNSQILAEASGQTQK